MMAPGVGSLVRHWFSLEIRSEEHVDAQLKLEAVRAKSLRV